MPECGPNLFLVLCDQMRAHAMRCMGNDQVETPNMDRLARNGALFEHAYTTKPMCTPARASIFTGQFPHRHRTIHNSLNLPTNKRTIGKVLRDAGYATGYVGKWHLHEGTPDFTIATRVGPGYIPPGPHRHGFEHWDAYNSTHEHLKGHPQFTETGDLYWEEGYQPELQTTRALDFVTEHRSRSPDRPFFVVLSWGPPHPPFEAPPEYRERYDPESLELRPNVPSDGIMDRPHKPPIDEAVVRERLAHYYGMVTSLDDQLARVSQALAELDIEDETILCFTSDHGEMMGSQGRCNKSAPFDEAARIPLLMRYPPEIRRSTTVTDPVSLADLMPTFLSMCGAETPSTVQGRDISSHFGETGTAETAPAFVQGWRIEDDVPGMDPWGPWEQPWRMVRSERYMLTIDRTLETKYFFDMETDPYQLDNLAGEPEYEEEEQATRKQLFEQIRAHDDREFMIRRSFIPAKREDLEEVSGSEGR